MWKQLDGITDAMEAGRGVLVRTIIEACDHAATSTCFVPDCKLIQNGNSWKIEHRTHTTGRQGPR